MTYRVVRLDELPERIDATNTNEFVVEILKEWVGHEGKWLDYASIKDTADLGFAKRLLKNDPKKFRVCGRMPEAQR